MPFEVRQGIEIDRSAAEVWPYLVAFEQIPLWEHGVIEVRQVSPGPPGLGTEVFARRLYAGRESRLTGSITAFEDGRSATMSLSGGPFSGSVVTYAVDAIDPGRSVVTCSVSVNLGGPLQLLGPILAAVGRAETRKNLARLKRRIDAGIPPRSNVPTPAR